MAAIDEVSRALEGLGEDRRRGFASKVVDSSHESDLTHAVFPFGIGLPDLGDEVVGHHPKARAGAGIHRQQGTHHR
jgi:hypothetical protein